MKSKEIANILQQMAIENYKEFIKGLIIFEKGIDDEKILDQLYWSYMENDCMSLLNDKFDISVNNGYLFDKASFKTF